MTASQEITLLVDGRRYGGLAGVEISRAIDKCVGEAQVSLSEQWLGQTDGWRIAPYTPVQVLIGDDLVLTGYCVAYEPRAEAEGRGVRLIASSKTCDLVDCTPDIPSGQYQGYSLRAIATAICGMFNIGLVIDPSVAEAVETSVADATIERCETAWTFLERLCRMAAVLATDTPKGELLLTRTGDTRASGALRQGENIVAESAKFDVRKRYSLYIVKGQSGICAGAVEPETDINAGIPRVADEVHYVPPGRATGTGQVQNAQHAQSEDRGVPRYRPHISIAESQLTQAGMQLRADWQRAYAYGRSIQIEITVPGFRQPDGRLWQVNQIVGVTASRLGIAQDLLIVRTAWRRGPQGAQTAITVAPAEGYAPDPGEVKIHKPKGRKRKGKAIMDLSGLGAVGGSEE